MSSQINRSKKSDFDSIILRLFTTWCMTAVFIKIANIKELFTDLAFAQDSNIFTLIALFACCFTAVSLADHYFPKKRIPGTTLLIFLTAYILLLAADAYESASNNSEIFFSAAILVILGVAVVYLVKNDKLYTVKFSPKATVVTVVILFLFSAAFISAVTVYRYLSYCTPNYDFGIFCNMFYNMRTKFLPLVTSERNQLLSHFAVHASPIYYLLLPFYALFPFPETLQIGQGVIAASGVIPLLLIGRKKELSDKITLALCAIYCFYPALSCGCFYDIHENCFLAPLLLWMFWFYEKKQFIPMYIFAALTLFVKEDAAIYVAFFALYLILSEKEFKHGTVVFSAAVAYFCAVTFLLSRFGDGVMTYRYNNYIFGDSGFAGMIKTVFINPGYVFTQILTGDKLIYLLKMLIPLGLLPFATKKISRFVLLLPMVLIGLMSDYIYQYDIGFQYQFGIIAFLFYISMANISDFKPTSARAMSIFGVVASILIFSVTAFPKLTAYSSRYYSYKDTYDKMNSVIAQVPKDASVKCTTFILPHMAARNEIYEIRYDPDNLHQTDYIVLDMRSGYQAESKKYIEEYLNYGYEIFIEEENIVTILIKQ